MSGGIAVGFAPFVFAKEAAGLTRAHDRLPEFMKYEPLPPHNTVYDVPDEALDAVFGKL